MKNTIKIDILTRDLDSIKQVNCFCHEPNKLKTKPQGNELVTRLIDLHERGYDHDFVLERGHMRCIQCDNMIVEEDFEITEILHIHYKLLDHIIYNIFAIQLRNSGIKGILMNSYQFRCGNKSIRPQAVFNKN